MFKLVEKFVPPEGFDKAGKVWGFRHDRSDCFAVGVAVYYMIHKEYPFSRGDFKTWATGSLLQFDFCFKQCELPLCKETINLTQGLTDGNAIRRMTMEQVVAHTQYKQLVEYVKE